MTDETVIEPSEAIEDDDEALFHPDPLADLALSLVCDCPAIHTAIWEHVRVQLGRGPNKDQDNDKEWWEAVTDAYNELFARMTTLNNTGRSQQ